MFYARATGAWLLILLLAILNGTLRESILLPQFGTAAAHLISGVLPIGCILILS